MYSPYLHLPQFLVIVQKDLHTSCGASLRKKVTHELRTKVLNHKNNRKDPLQIDYHCF